MTKVILEFPDDESADCFLAYWADGGGEYSYLEYGQKDAITPIRNCDYSRCFPAWGYNEDKHGKDRAVVFEKI